MHDKPKEPDWKAFRAMVPELRERHLEKVNAELAALLKKEGSTPTERFWAIEERIGQEAKILRQCLDGHSRSQMTLFMALMLRHGMLADADLQSFSPELAGRLRNLCSL